MLERGRIREGMTVHSADGERLGKITSCGDATFIVEKGLFLQSDRVCRLDEVATVDGDDVHLFLTRDELRGREVGDDARRRRPGEEGSDAAWAASEFGGLGVDRSDQGRVTGDPPNLLDPGLGDRRRKDPEGD